MKKMYIVTCPICGKIILKGRSIEEAEVHCPRCNANLHIAMGNNSVRVTEMLEEQRA